MDDRDRDQEWREGVARKIDTDGVGRRATPERTGLRPVRRSSDECTVGHPIVSWPSEVGAGPKRGSGRRGMFCLHPTRVRGECRIDH